jgi:hypothetical protein
MGRQFFNLTDRRMIPDTDGQECVDREEAKKFA